METSEERATTLKLLEMVLSSEFEGVHRLSVRKKRGCKKMCRFSEVSGYFVEGKHTRDLYFNWCDLQEVLDYNFKVVRQHHKEYPGLDTVAGFVGLVRIEGESDKDLHKRVEECRNFYTQNYTA